MSYINLYNKNGDKYNLSGLNLFGLKLHVPSPSYTVETETVDGGSGVIVLDKKLNPRDLVAEFYSKSGNYEDALNLRDDLYAILNNGEPVYIGDTRTKGKRWFVHPNGWTPEHITGRTMKFDVPLLAPTGTAETVNVISRKFSADEFTFRIDGTVPIDMSKQDETEINFRGISDGLIIKNLTTGDEWSYSGTTTDEDVLLLKGVSSTKNGNSIFGQTNMQLISFAPGINKIEIKNATDFSLEIRTRFYFL